MIGFAPRPGGGYTVAFDRHEATLISDLAGQIAELLSPLTAVPPSSPDAPLSPGGFGAPDPFATLEAEGSLALHGDPAIARLLPDAYGDEADADSASDFRRYTEQGLVNRKIANALVVVDTLAPSIDDRLSDGLSGGLSDELSDGLFDELAGGLSDELSEALSRASEASAVDGPSSPAVDSPNSSAADSPIPVSLTEAQAQSWLRSLTDIRLTLASRIGIETDEDASENDVSDVDGDGDGNGNGGSESDSGLGLGSESDHTAWFLRDIYHWLGFVTESLLAAIDREPDARPH